MRTMTKGTLLLAALGATALSGVSVEAQDEYRLRGSSVAVYNLAGEARLVPGSGSEVVVRVERNGADAAGLRIETGVVRGRESLRVVYPTDRVIYDAPGRGNFNSTVRVRPDGTFSDGGDRRGDRVEVSSRGRGFEAHVDLVIEVPAGTDMAVYVAVGEVDAADIDGNLLIDTGSGAVTATNIGGDLSVDTGSGSVSVRDIRGNLMVDTGSGSVELEGVVGRDVMIDTGSGSVRGYAVEARRLNVDTGSGRIQIEGVNAPEILLDTGSGSVDVEILTDVEELLIDTGSGSVTVALPESAGAEVELDTGNGGIQVDLPLQVRRASRDHVVGRLGDGRGSIEIDSGSGSIRIVRTRSSGVR